ncbi:hypothetical protein [Cupriavidus basilensis]|uniref:hypothetical protein n=1 Tax=Cupriavidus basilensis TaxID=68895 RepID=UPI0039F6D7AB
MNAPNVRLPAVVAQLSALANFMFADGREAFELLTDHSKANLRVMFDMLRDDFDELVAGGEQ